MKKFLRVSLLFVVVAFIVLLVLDLTVTKELRASRLLPYAGWNDIVDGKAASDVLIMGSSRAWTQYSPIILDSILHVESYNLGIDGSHFNRQRMKYDMYRVYNEKPKLIIQNIDYCSTLTQTIGYMDYQYYPYFYNNEMRQRAFSMEHFDFAEKYLPVYRYMKFGVRRMFLEESIGPMCKGYYGRPLTWDGSRFRELDTILFRYDNTTLRLFADFLREAKEEGIKVIMVYAPIFSEVTERMENVEEMYSIYDSLSRQFDVPILDYNYDSICSDTTCFYNATHLNAKGARLFSNKLAQDIASMSLL